MEITTWDEGVNYTAQTRQAWRTGGGRIAVLTNARHFTDFAGPNLPLKEITRKLVKSYCFHLEDLEYAATTINRHISPISTVLNHLVEEEEIDIPIPKFKRYKESLGRPYYFTRAQFDDILANIKQRRLYDIVQFAGHTGGRRGELLTLTVRDIDFNANLIYFGGRPEFNTKNGDWRTVPITDALRPMLIQRTEGIPKDVAIFGDEWEYPNKVLKKFKQVTKQIGLGPEFVFHCLRHSFATWHCEVGTPMRVLMDLMGHKRIETTLRYAKATDKARNEAMISCFS